MARCANYPPVNNTIAVIVSIKGLGKPVIRGDPIAITLTIVVTELLTCWFVRADCSTADEPGQVPQIGGLSSFGKVSTKKKKKKKLSRVQMRTSNMRYESFKNNIERVTQFV